MAVDLTPQEHAIIIAIINGNTADKDLARLFAIRKRTAEKHMERIRQKTGVRRAGLPRWAKQNLGGEYGQG